MKISELKQPYKRMAEYLVTQNCIQEAGYGIYNFYKQGSIMDLFWNSVDKGNHTEITEEIKTHFPINFDFSGEESLNEKYTQLAKEGKFDELPETCEFSEAVDLEVWDRANSATVRGVYGRFRGSFVAERGNEQEGFYCWKYAKLPTQKIDFSEFKIGDVVEVLTKSQGFFWGMFSTNETDFIRLTFGTESGVTKQIYKDQINLITKIK